MSSPSRRSRTTVVKFAASRHQFAVGQKVLDRFTVTTPALPGPLGDDYHAIDTRQRKPYVLQLPTPEVANHYDFIESVAKQLYVCGSIKENDLVPAGELLQAAQLKLRIIAFQDYGQESVESRQEIIEAGGKFGVKALLGFLERAGAALDKLGRAGRAHLALRPSDIIITSHGTVMVTNWWYNWDLLQAAAKGRLGAAAAVQNTLLSGKHSTLAPETFQALRIIAGFAQGELRTPDRQADQFSLALIFARTLNRAAVVPAAEPLTAVSVAIDSVPFLNVAQRQVLQRALAAQPLDRFESCTAFLQALQGELPGSEYIAEKSFRDPLFEHVLTHQAAYSDGDVWQEFLERAADQKLIGYADNIELLKRARAIWQELLGHGPDAAAAPLKKTIDNEPPADDPAALETGQQRFDRLRLLFEELRLGLSTSGFEVSAQLAGRLEEIEREFARSNPSGSDSGSLHQALTTETAGLPVGSAAAGSGGAGSATGGTGGTGRTSSGPGDATAGEMDPASPEAMRELVRRAQANVASQRPGQPPPETIDPIALLDAFAPVTRMGGAPQIDPPRRRTTPAAGVVVAAAPAALPNPSGDAMLTEFRESIRTGRTSRAAAAVPGAATVAENV
ncbi:MAG: hypothetical protein ACREJ2_01670, partial [Planctomycetota bacterium]